MPRERAESSPTSALSLFSGRRPRLVQKKPICSPPPVPAPVPHPLLVSHLLNGQLADGLPLARVLKDAGLHHLGRRARVPGAAAAAAAKAAAAAAPATTAAKAAPAAAAAAAAAATEPTATTAALHE